MAFDHIAQPGHLGGLEIKNRISLSPMEKNWCDRLGNPGQNYIDYYALRASHGVGSMNFEATYIDPRGRGNLFQLGLWCDDNIPAHKRLNEAVQAHGCRTTAELNHGGRNTNMHRTGLQSVGPSNLPFPMVGGHELHALTVEEIGEIVDRYRDGARRAAEAGYDMITIHGAHGYLITNFLSFVHNQRTDAYGGSDENRWRFLIEIYQAMRDEVGRDMPIGVRLSAQEEIDGGYDVGYTLRLVQHLESLGLDFVDVSTGLYESIETLIQPMDFRPGCLMPLARQFKDAVSIPVVSAGRVNNMTAAETILAAGDCDFVHMGRAFHADPEILSKSLDGRQDEIVSCIACNKCCMELFVNKPSVCTVNPAAGREREMALRPASHKRKVVVAGGDIAALEAAATAARRGHGVTLLEPSDRLGGYLNVIGAPKFRQNWCRAVEDRVRIAKRAGVEFKMQTEPTLEAVEDETPDVVIISSGSRPFVPKYIPGWDLPFVTDYDSLISGETEVGSRVAVLGGQMLGMAVAEFVAEAGAEVTVIEQTDAIAQDLEYMAQQALNARLAKSNQIELRLSTNVERIAEGGVLTLQSGGELSTIDEIDQVVFAIERTMDRSVVDALSVGLEGRDDIEWHTIGDCIWPQEPYDAILEGHMLARTL